VLEEILICVVGSANEETSQKTAKRAVDEGELLVLVDVFETGHDVPFG
jgi:hypothetical protein